MFPNQQKYYRLKKKKIVYSITEELLINILSIRIGFFFFFFASCYAGTNSCAYFWRGTKLS